MPSRVVDSKARRRYRAAARYRPHSIRLLLIAEAPPPALDRYFYFPDVPTQDSLFRYVVRTVLRREPTRNKRQELGTLRDAGVFLIDLCLVPLSADSRLIDCVPGLVRRAKALSPAHVILVKAGVYDIAFNPLLDAGLPVVNARIPFPGSGHQLRFETAMRGALRSIRWRPTA